MLRIYLLLISAAPGFAAVQPPASVDAMMRLAEHGQCGDALLALKRAAPSIPARDTRKRAEVDAIRCAMTLDREADARDLLTMLDRDFGKDPDALYLETHVYSELSIRASQRLLFSAPASPQVHELNAEALESQGQWDAARKEYEQVLATDPKLPGIHYRIGRLILSQPKSAETPAEARREMEAELAIDPNNAGAEYVLGELARQDERWPAAIEAFRKASELDTGFADAYYGLGIALMSAGEYEQALSPLQTAERMQPDNPSVHYQLAVTLTRLGRKAEADREAALQKETTEKAQQKKDELQKGVQAGVGPK